MRRTPDDIEAEILKVVKSRGVAGKTAIVYGANLNFKIVVPYLSRLVDRGLLILDDQGKHKKYRTGPLAEAFVDTLAILRGI